MVTDSEGDGKEDNDDSKHHKENSLVFEKLPEENKSKNQDDDLELVVHILPVVLQALHQAHYLDHHLIHVALQSVVGVAHLDVQNYLQFLR